MEGKELTALELPNVRQRMKPTSRRAKKRELGIEMAAMAYVAMENGDYVYGNGSHKVQDKQGRPVPNKSELMRLAGYAPSCKTDFDATLEKNADFWHLVELHRIRRTDPLFEIGQERALWLQILGDAERLLYERLHYEPHSVSISDTVKIATMITNSYFKSAAVPPKGNRTDELLSQLPAEQRQKAISGMKAAALAELERIESLERLG